MSKAIDRRRDDEGDVNRVRAWLDEHRRRAGVSLGQINEAMGLASNGGGMASIWTTSKTPRAVPQWEQWLALKALCELPDDMDAEVWRLNGRKGQPGEAWEQREVVSTRQVQDIRNGHGRAVGSAMFAGEDTDKIEHATTLPATPEAEQWEGWGTALKPSHEPIVVARKPLIGTVAANVLEHGTGALNIDGCRIGLRGDYKSKPNGRPSLTGLGDNYDPAEANQPDTAGRWPANAVFSHTEDCVRVGQRTVRSGTAQEPDGKQMERSIYGATGTLGRDAGYADEDGMETVEAWECGPNCPVAALDAQSGELTSGSRAAGVRSGLGYHGANGDGGPAIEGSVGGASRFFGTFGFSTIDECPLPGAASTEAENTSAGKRTADSGGDSPTDGCGNKRTDPSRPDTTFTTATTTRSTTTPPISNSSSGKDTSVTTEPSEPPRLSGRDGVSARAATSGRISTPSPREPQDPDSPTARIAEPPTSESGGSATASTTPRTCAPIESATGEPRFRYCAKVSMGEREAGLLGRIRCVVCGEFDSTSHAAPTDDDPDRRQACRRNIHPTLKPIDLMRWLVRLVTPPGGVVLDPFTGSGTTGIAAGLEGFEFVGIERDEEYAKIARARIEWWAQHPEGLDIDAALQGDARRRKVAESGQGSLLDALGKDPA